MLKWSKQRGKKNGANVSNRSEMLNSNSNNERNDNPGSTNDEGSDIRISRTMVEQESALAEARRRFSAQISNESSLAIQRSLETPEIHVDSPSDTCRPVSLNYQSPFIPPKSDNRSIVCCTSFDQEGNPCINTLERGSRANNNINVPGTSHSNCSTLERGGAKSKYCFYYNTFIIFLFFKIRGKT
jgi:hypothetical protein